MDWHEKLDKHRLDLEKEKLKLTRDILDYLSNPPDPDYGCPKGITVWPNQMKLVAAVDSYYNDQDYSNVVNFTYKDIKLVDCQFYHPSDLFLSVKSLKVDLKNQTVEFVF